MWNSIKDSLTKETNNSFQDHLLPTLSHTTQSRMTIAIIVFFLSIFFQLYAFPQFRNITGYNSKSQKTDNLSKPSIYLKKKKKIRTILRAKVWRESKDQWLWG